MKRIVLYTLLFVSLVACNKNSIDIPEKSSGKDFTAIMESDQAKTTLSNQTVLWSSSDQVYIFQGTLKKNQANLYRVKDGCEGNIATTLTPAETPTIGSNTQYNVALYGQVTRDLYLNDSGTIWAFVDIPETQVHAENSFGENTMPMAAVCPIEDSELSFKNICGALELNLKGDGFNIQSISVTGNNNEVIAGEYSFDLSESNSFIPRYFYNQGNKKTITLNCSTPVTLSEQATTFYIVIPPVRFSKGITVKINTEDGYTITKSTTKRLDILRNQIQPMSELTLEDPNPAYISFVDPEVKAVCISHFDTNDDGKLSYTEAAAVTNEQAAGCFTSNDKIRRFPEFQYFTSITNLGKDDYCGFFEGCTSLESVVLPPTLISISDGAFNSCRSIISLSIPSPVKYMWGHILWGCTSLTDLFLNSSNPPELESTFWKSEFESATLHVPAGRVYAYESWLSYFGTITDGTNTIRNPRYVDLGLSVKWAEWNLGANSPEEYGYYYAWGETTPKATFNKNDYKFYSNYQYTKYVTQSTWGTVDNKRTLELADDAANVTLGGKWRMPTLAEAQELYDKCTWTKETINGVKGYRLTSKVAGYTDKSIFFPYAGAYITNTYQPDFGTYWTSSLSEFDCFDARNINMGDSESASNYIDYDQRYEGRPIRPVYK